MWPQFFFFQGFAGFPIFQHAFHNLPFFFSTHLKVHYGNKMWFASCSLKRKAGVDWGTISLRKRKKMQYKYNTNLKIIQVLSFNVSTCVYFNIYLKCIVVPPILSNLSKILYFFFQSLSVFIPDIDEYGGQTVQPNPLYFTSVWCDNVGETASPWQRAFYLL